MLELAVVEGDLAWYPNTGCGNDFSYPRQSGWTTRKPPESANEGFEGGAMFYHLQPLRGFIRYYLATGERIGAQFYCWNMNGKKALVPFDSFEDAVAYRASNVWRKPRERKVK